MSKMRVSRTFKEKSSLKGGKRLNPIYLFKNGTFHRENNTLSLRSEGEVKYIPIENVSEIKVFGDVDINKRILEFLAQNRIPMHFYNRFGHYAGTFYPYEYMSNGCTVLQQALCYQDGERRLALARLFIEGASANMKSILNYYKRRERISGDTLAHFEQLQKRLPETGNIEELMAIEGNIREFYYRSFDDIVNNGLFYFEKRTKQPPENHMNTLISFGNSLLYSTTLTELYKTALDPRIGFLHATNFRKFSLNLDIAEIFKPIIVDRTIFSLINRDQLSEKHFKGIERGIHLNEEGRKIFIIEYEKHLTQTIRHEKLKRNVSFRTLIRHEAYKIIKAVLGMKPYVPFHYS
jgi:CRISPR-associated protein Cas1